MTRIKAIIICVVLVVISVYFADKYRVKGNIEPKFKFGQIVRIKDFDSKKFKVIKYCTHLHETDSIYTKYSNRDNVDYINYHLLNTYGEEIVIAEFNLEAVNEN